MKFLRVNIIIFFVFSSCLCAQTSFETYFSNKTMRVDLILAGNQLEQQVYIMDILEEPHFGGSRNSLIDRFNYGEYRFFIIDKTSSDTIYSRGFCTLFEEWRTTLEAQSQSKAFYQSINFPCPKNKIILCIDERLKNGSYNTILSQEINPKNDNIRKARKDKHEVVSIVNTGTPDKSLDLTFIAEGYTKDELSKFKEDVQRHTEYLLNQAPFSQFKNQINVWAICSPSKDSGPSEPERNNWRETAVSSSFNTFYIDRYLETSDVKSIRDIAACAPYDHIIVLVNSKRYGGGGIYNHFSIGTADHPLSEKVLIHEIGHGLFGLADEYYTSDVAYQNFFDLNTEPWQANITTLIHFEAKWKDQLPHGLPIPTPASKKYHNEIGVFEGGGYVEKGVYRPAINCRMKSNEAQGFCKVCTAAGYNMINFLTE